MAIVRFPRHLTNQFPIPGECAVEGRTVAEIVDQLERHYPGVARYLLDDQGAVRQHVNIFIGERWITDRAKLSDAITEDDEIFIMQALSGG